MLISRDFIRFLWNRSGYYIGAWFLFLWASAISKFGWGIQIVFLWIPGAIIYTAFPATLLAFGAFSLLYARLWRWRGPFIVAIVGALWEIEGSLFNPTPSIAWIAWPSVALFALIISRPKPSANWRILFAVPIFAFLPLHLFAGEFIVEILWFVAFAVGVKFGPRETKSINP